MAQLILGPAVRYVSDTEATVWMETDAPCRAEVLGHDVPTFCVEGHHYALVVVKGLQPGDVSPYDVKLDGELAWPLPDDPYPPPVLRTLPAGGRLRVAFGSCRVSVPHEPPYTLRKDEDDRGRELDALYALTQRMLREPADNWPHVMVMLGDQVYADEVSPATREFIRERRDPEQPPGEEIADYEEYTHLYREAWRDPTLRWFMSCVSTSMIWDDHDVHDDWNTSYDWVQEMRTKPWWDKRIRGGIASYWVYQHIGNLSPRELGEDEMWDDVCGCEDAGKILHDFARKADRENEGTRWSYYRDLGATRLVMMDSRAGRVLKPGERSMVDQDEWEWIAARAQEKPFDHLLLGTSLPILLSPAMHNLEAWNEAVCDGAWGKTMSRAGEWFRQELDLEHWAAFDDSFDNLVALMQAVAVGDNGDAPASIVALSGDVHHAYLAEVAFRRGSRARSAVYQAVCSPVRNPLDANERRAMNFGFSRPATAFARALARSARVEDPTIRWRIGAGPYFDNQVATLDIEGRTMVLRIERARAQSGGGTERDLETVLERRLA
jgi:hypothetical protein